jgi:hypothetical protein
MRLTSDWVGRGPFWISVSIIVTIADKKTATEESRNEFIMGCPSCFAELIAICDILRNLNLVGMNITNADYIDYRGLCSDVVG